MIMAPAGLTIFAKSDHSGFGVWVSAYFLWRGRQWARDGVARGLSVLVSWHESLDTAVLFCHGEDAGLVLE